MYKRQVLRGVYDLAALENTAGGSVTAIGWPTQGGECGSELLASSDIAICATGDTAGAWAFLKFCLSDAQLQEQLATTSFPISRAALEARLAEHGRPVWDQDALTALLSYFPV